MGGLRVTYMKTNFGPVEILEFRLVQQNSALPSSNDQYATRTYHNLTTFYFRNSLGHLCKSRCLIFKIAHLIFHMYECFLYKDGAIWHL